MLSATLLIIAICLDSFAVSVTYGVGKIKIPFLSAIVISLIGIIFLALSMLTASLFSSFLSKDICSIIGFSILIILGLYNFIQPIIKKKCVMSAKSSEYQSKKSFLFVYLDETNADFDMSKSLSVQEAFLLAIALSLDSLATGLSYGLGISLPYLVLGMAFLVCFFSIMIGCKIGFVLSRSSKFDLSFIGGILLIILGILKIL